MKVMLTCPNDSPLTASFEEKGAISVPLSLAYLGAYVRVLPGIAVVGFDNNAQKLPVEKYRDIFRREQPDVVGISILTATVFRTWEMARTIKEVLPRAIIVVGGMHCSALPENTMKEKAIDYGVIGEGEEPFRDLLLALQAQRDPTGIPNLVWRRADQVVVNPRRPPIKDLDQIPFPARDLFDDTYYGITANRRATAARSATILTSRGCPYGCMFCSKSIYGRNFNQRSPQNVIDEMQMLARQGYGEVLIVDDTFTVNRAWVLEFCRRFVEAGAPLFWNCHARVNTIDEEVVQAMKQAHCTGMAFGIESGNPAMLKKIDKGITMDQARTAVRLCRQYGIRTLCSYIFGHPGDTRATAAQTLQFALELDSDYANFAVLIPMPGSKVFEDLHQQGRIDENNWELYLGHAKTYLDISVCEIPAVELHAMQRRAFRRFYFRPKYIWRKLCAVRSAGALGNLISGAYLVALFVFQTLFRRRKQGPSPTPETNR